MMWHHHQLRSHLQSTQHGNSKGTRGTFGKTPTSFVASCSFLQGLPVCPFPCHPWGSSLPQGCQLRRQTQMWITALTGPRTRWLQLVWNIIIFTQKEKKCSLVSVCWVEWEPWAWCLTLAGGVLPWDAGSALLLFTKEASDGRLDALLLGCFV